jgi:hypothetical protein
MKPAEIVGLSIFGALVVGALALAVFRESRQRDKVAAYASSRAWSVVKARQDPLWSLLDAMDADVSWSPGSIVLADPAAPRRAYFFLGQTSSRFGRSRQTEVYASFAERAAGWPQKAVRVEPRIPALEMLVDNRVETGGEDFRRAYTVSCADAASARTAVNPEIQRMLLDHAGRFEWGLVVTIARSGVVVESPQAKAEADWDYLIALAKKLRAALG